MPDRAAWVLEAGWIVVADTVVSHTAAACWGWRRFERGSFARKLPHLHSIGWMTYCLGRRWTSAPPGLSPALVLCAPQWGVRRFVFCGAPGSNDHFLFRSERVRGFTAPTLGASGYSTDFSMPAYAAGL